MALAEKQRQRDAVLRAYLKVGKVWLSIWTSAIGGVRQIPEIPGLTGTFQRFGGHCFPFPPFPICHSLE